MRRISLDVWLGLAVGGAAFALLLATLGQPFITWDEGSTIAREEKVRQWFRLLISPPPPFKRAHLFQEPLLSACWPFAREEPDGHPPFYAVLGNAGWKISHAWLPPLQAHRFGPVVLCSITLGVMYLFLARRWGRLAGFVAAGSWLLMPRVFAHAHLALYDMPLACLWFLSAAAFWKARECWRVSFGSGVSWSVVFACLLAMAAATKFTGWLIPLPLLVWSGAAAIGALRREGRGCLKKLARLSVLLVLPLLLAAIELQLVARVFRVESSLEPQTGERSLTQSARAAHRSRTDHAARPVHWVLFANPVCWGLVYGGIAVLNRRSNRLGVRSSSAAVQNPHTEATDRDMTRVAPLAEVWAVAAGVTPSVTLLLVPTWWSDPLGGLAIFLWSNLTRDKTISIPTEFFGTTYEFALPWYNTLAWVALTVPPGILLFVMFGVIAAVRNRTVGDRSAPVCGDPVSIGPESRSGNPSPPARRDSEAPAPLPADEERGEDERSSGLGCFLLLNGLTVLVIRALPNAPGHDGERQLLGCFPFLAGLAGLGAESVRRCLARRLPAHIAARTAWGLVAAALAWAAGAIWYYRTAPLSYYTELVGGLPGAARRGLEPTYYWDSLDVATLRWLNEHTAADEKVLFCAYFESMRYLRQWELLRVKVLPQEPGVWRWYVLQNRPGPFSGRPWDRWLAEHGRPAYTRQHDGVPLIWIFPYDEYEQARTETRSGEG